MTIQVMTKEERLAANTKKAIKASKEAFRLQQQTGDSSEGASITPEVPDELTGKPQVKELVLYQRFLMRKKAALQQNPMLKLIGVQKMTVTSLMMNIVNVDDIPWVFTEEEEKGDKMMMKNMMIGLQVYERDIPAHKNYYDALLQSINYDEDDMDKAVAADQSTQSVSAKEPDEEHVHKVIMDAEGNIANEMGNAKEKPDKWNKCQVVDDQPEQTWFNNMIYAEKDPLTFDVLMTLPIDFSKFAMNHLKIDKLTKTHLVGPVYELLKGTCESSIELEYDMEEWYKALTEKILNTSSTTNLLLESSNSERKYTTSITKMKAARFELVGIEDMIPKLWSIPAKEIIKTDVCFSFEDSECGKIEGQKNCMVSGYLGVVYEDQRNQKRLMRADELYKFSDGTLKLFQDTLHHMLRNFRLGYNKDKPRRKWSATDKKW
ncbi:hypothetical protein Tco_0691688 [Tanacetum coccineum]